MITGVVLARNEQRNIAACLRLLRPHVEELLLIDMESEDATIAEARPFIDDVLSHPLTPNFDAARNLAIPAAHNDWLWFVDADERVSHGLGQLVRQLIVDRGADFESITIPFKSHFCGQWMRHCGWWPGYTMPRVLKRGYFSFSPTLHGGVQQTGRNIFVPPDPNLAIEHYSYESVEHYLTKLNRYTSTEALQIAGRGGEHDWRTALGQMMHDLWVYYELNPGRADGARGWILSWLSGQYRWLSHAKLIDVAPERDNGVSAPADLDDALNHMQLSLAECRAKTPRAPLGIVWRGPVWDPSGYADDSRTFAKALAAGDRQILLEDIRWSDKEYEMPATDSALLRALERARRPRDAITITNCICTLVKPDPASAFNVLRTTFETDRLPEGWLEALLEFDEIWVISHHNYRTFARSWVPPEKLRIVPSCFDHVLFQPHGQTCKLPDAASDRYVFLSVFDWDLRKGWDVLIAAYAESFRAQDGTALLLKITRNHGHSLQAVRDDSDRVLREMGQSLAERPDIVIYDDILAGEDLASLYRSVNAFVLPSRGEGWGRPYMEAMASGLPCIGTNASGNIDFMTADNSFLLKSSECLVPDSVSHGLQTYKGHLWFEPDCDELKKLMRFVFEHADEARRRGLEASREVRSKYSLHAGERAIEHAVRELEVRIRHPESPLVTPDQITVHLQGGTGLADGEFYAATSLFANLALLSDIAASISPEICRSGAPASLRALTNRDIGEPQVCLQFGATPSWVRPPCGKWIYMLPVATTSLPQGWIAPLRDHVDEIWLTSQFALRACIACGLAPEKLFVLPVGVDTGIFKPHSIPLLLPTSKSFRFLFVGELTRLSGFDILLDAYVRQFAGNDDVCLVVTDSGGPGEGGTFRTDLMQTMDRAGGPQIVYIERPLTPRQRAMLYASCHCLVFPYRSTAYFQTVMEAMASGIPAVLPHGGPTNDVATGECVFLVNAPERPAHNDSRLAGPCLELTIDPLELGRIMRSAFDSPNTTREKGLWAAHHIQSQFTWNHTSALARDRIRTLTGNTGGVTPRRNGHEKLVTPGYDLASP